MPARSRLVVALVLLSTGLAALGSSPATAHQLYPNFPDPFCATNDETTTIPYELSAPAMVDIRIRGPYDQVLRHLVYEMQAAGSHSVVWDGRDDGGTVMPVGTFTIELRCDGQTFTDDCLIFCGVGVAGPWRDAAGIHDIELGFFVSLAEAGNIQLDILNGAGTSVVRRLVNGACPAGVSLFSWDLRNTSGTRVSNGNYSCRLVAPGYDAQIPFAAHPIRPLSVTCALTDIHGGVRTGSLDPGAPTAVETPVPDCMFLFNRSVDADEIDTLLDGCAYGVFEHINSGTITAGFDSTWAYLDNLQPDSTRTWPDLYGAGRFEFNPRWVSPSTCYFHLKHTFQGITATNEDCGLIGTIDPRDWRCGPYAVPGGPAPAPTGFSLRTVCPNPVVPGGATRIAFSLPQACATTVCVVDTAGLVVSTLVQGVLSAGYHTAIWDTRASGGELVPAGIYRVIGEFGQDVVCGGDIAVSDELVAVPDPRGGAPGLPRLVGCWPNPFNPRTTIRFELPAAQRVRLTVYDLAGRLVRTLVDGDLSPGPQAAVWDGRDDAHQAVASGSYFARLEAGGRIETMTMGLVR